MKKYNLALIITAAVILELTATIQYFMARRGVTTEIIQKANRDMEQNQQLVAVKSLVESAVTNHIDEVEEVVDSADQLFNIVAKIVRINRNIVGAGVAYRPGYFEKQGKTRLYSPYAFDQNPESSTRKNDRALPNVKSRLLDFDYTTREWYQEAMKNDTCIWTEPYVDKGGTYIVMCSYTVPVKDRNGNKVGVLFADVPLSDLTVMANEMYSGIDRSGLYVFILQIVGILAVILIIWRATIAFRRYKERNIDPEKDHLVEQVAKLKEINRRLTERNMDLAKKLQTAGQQTDPHWFG